ncbi:hypothetical protein [Paenibacillus sp. GP183]|uniref:hypothetical protein n=1 Tax=Paenibacillus sp. GP183 TaxID=1882751 RepID=UPI0011151E0E|nr:hypothetical protein [Paenibacillus sp. GP183]
MMLAMKKNETLSQATFQANVSCLIGAKTKKHALEKAANEWNKASIHIDPITLENEIGQSKHFTVVQVEQMDWFDVENAECSNQYRVFGRIRLSISELKQTDYYINDFDQFSYKIPPSLVGKKPVLVVSEGLRHIFLTVSQQVAKWNNKEESRHLSKLA